MKRAMAALIASAAGQFCSLAAVIILFSVFITDFPFPQFYPTILALASAQVVGLAACLGFLLPQWPNSLEGRPRLRVVSAWLFGIATVIGVLVAVAASLFAFWPKVHPNRELSYARVAAVSDTWARLWVRSPVPPDSRLTVWWRPVDSDAPWSSGSVKTDETRDWTGVVVATNLSSATNYVWTTMDPSTDAGGEHTIKFRTAPAPDALAPISFAWGSCMIPTATMTFDHLPEIRDQDPDFLIFLGDFIYADVPWMIGKERADYQAKYRQVWDYDNARTLFREIPSFLLFDDHEVDNDWVRDSDTQHDQIMNALQAWSDYIGEGNPQTFASRSGLDPAYFDFRWGRAADFFMVDSRSFRIGDSFLGETQFRRLEEWLVQSDAIFKFIASPVSFSFSKYSDDVWTSAGQDELVDILRRNNATNVVLLSGDLHLGIAAEVQNPQALPGLFEFTVSPWGAFIFPAIEPDDVLFYKNGEQQLSGYISVDPSGAEPAFTVLYYGSGNEVFWSQEFVLRNGRIQLV